MSGQGATLADVVDGLAQDGLLSDAQRQRATTLMHRAQPPPWYVRTLVGIGAWLASLLLIGFVAGLSLATGASALVGLALIAGALFLRRTPAVQNNDFTVQFAMATSLAGQALFTWGIAEPMDGDELELLFVLIMVTSTLLFFGFPDPVHRVIMVMFATAALVGLLYKLELNGALPLLAPLLAGCLVYLDRRRAGLFASGRGRLVQPLENGLLLSAFGCMLLSTVYLLPELGLEFSFYPRPWLSTLLLGALWIYTAIAHRPWSDDGAATVLPIVVLALMAAIVAGAWWAPGIVLGLLVTTLGAARGHATFAFAGIGFLALFTAAYFYGIEVPMLTKSATLVATGTVLLAARWLLLRLVRSAEP